MNKKELEVKVDEALIRVFKEYGEVFRKLAEYDRLQK